MILALGELLKLEEFVYANLQIGTSATPVPYDKKFKRGQGASHDEGLEWRDGCVYWSWKLNGVETDSIFHSGKYWSIRLPLANGKGKLGYLNLYRGFDDKALMLDINYLSTLFQHELTQAAQRVFEGEEFDKSKDDKPAVAPWMTSSLETPNR